MRFGSFQSILSCQLRGKLVMNKVTKAGLVIAMAAAAVFAAGCASTGTGSSGGCGVKAAPAPTCKGMSSCKGTNSCGKDSCKS